MKNVESKVHYFAAFSIVLSHSLSIQLSFFFFQFNPRLAVVVIYFKANYRPFNIEILRGAFHLCQERSVCWGSYFNTLNYWITHTFYFIFEIKDENDFLLEFLHFVIFDENILNNLNIIESMKSAKKTLLNSIQKKNSS